MIKSCFTLVAIFLLCFAMAGKVSAASTGIPAGTDVPVSTTNSPTFGFTIQTSGEEGLAGSVEMIIILTIIALAPSLLILVTSFTRILVVLHFTRAALATQSAPPNQVLIAMSLFLTFFIMQPTLASVYQDAIIPFEAGELEQAEAFEIGMQPFRQFMYSQTQTKDVRLFMEISGTEWGEGNSLDSIPNTVLIPAFIISELRTAFIIGFLIYIPFIVIDMVVASTLMSMGMMMLPPTTISMPFKILLFVLADGWYLVIKGVVESFYY